MMLRIQGFTGQVVRMSSHSPLPCLCRGVEWPVATSCCGGFCELMSCYTHSDLFELSFSGDGVVASECAACMGSATPYLHEVQYVVLCEFVALMRNVAVRGRI
eukprot:TRINITY_DN19750_c0_g1_i1.p2 TRINITY_DN19750_c0_g1~~TRINITY_DN19750_c0_g1_i1.p2  ORF type:complete len:103 (+),score=0.58 TRINITY_DN19750_c0_g1_i1:396-704(+)